MSDSNILHNPNEIKTLQQLFAEHWPWFIKRGYKYLRRYRSWVRLLLSFILVLTFFILTTESYKAGFHQGADEWEKLRTSLFKMKQMVTRMQTENQLLRQELTALKQQHEIKSVELQSVLAQLKQLTAENAELKEDKLLYQSVLGKPNQRDSLKR